MKNAHGRTCNKTKLLSIYIHLSMKTFLKTGVYIYIYILCMNILCNCLDLHAQKECGIGSVVGHL